MGKSQSDPTKEEALAIASLERLARRWPKSLMLFSWSGTLCVVRLNEDGANPLLTGEFANDAQASVLTTIEIPNDGGDP